MTEAFAERFPYGVVCADCGRELKSEEETGTRLTDDSATDLSFSDEKTIPVLEVLCKDCEGK